MCVAHTHEPNPLDLGGSYWIHDGFGSDPLRLDPVGLREEFKEYALLFASSIIE